MISQTGKVESNTGSLKQIVPYNIVQTREMIRTIAAVLTCLTSLLVFTASAESLLENVDGGLYYTSDTELNWFDGETFCESHGGQLATFPTLEHYSAVFTHFMARGKYSLFWVGYHDLNSRNKFVGVDDSLPHLRWGRNQPDSDRSNENCVALFKDDGAHDVMCELRMAVLCKKSATSKTLRQSKLQW
jgi:hypothetical protein